MVINNFGIWDIKVKVTEVISFVRNQKKSYILFCAITLRPIKVVGFLLNTYIITVPLFKHFCINTIYASGGGVGGMHILQTSLGYNCYIKIVCIIYQFIKQKTVVKKAHWDDFEHLEIHSELATDKWQSIHRRLISEKW